MPNWSIRHLSQYLTVLVEGRLWLKVLIGMGLGLLVGIALGPNAGFVAPSTGELIGEWLALPGQLFLVSVQMIVVPLVLASVILGLTSSEDPSQLKKLGLGVVAYFLATTALAAAIGLWIAGLFRPGDSLVGTQFVNTAPAAPPVNLEGGAALTELPNKLIGILPGNPLNSMVQGDMLQIVIFAVVIGVACLAMSREQSRPILDLMSALQQVCMTVVRWAMILAPVAVFGLMARLTSQVGATALLGTGFYVGTVLIGLVVLLCIYMALLFLVTRVQPLDFLRKSPELMLLAFSTSSSAAVMPLSIKTAGEQFGVRASTARFVIPLGATINMNGTALYQGVATMFLAQVYGIDLSMTAMVLVVAIAVGSAVGSPGTPGVGIVILSMVLTSVGIPAEGVALIMGVDRIVDMCRTAVNVAGDLVAAQLMDGWLGNATEDDEDAAKHTPVAPAVE